MFFFKWFVVTALLLLLGCVSQSAIVFGFIITVIDSIIEDDD